MVGVGRADDHVVEIEAVGRNLDRPALRPARTTSRAIGLPSRAVMRRQSSSASNVPFAYVMLQFGKFVAAVRTSS